MEFRVAKVARITGEMLERLVREALKEQGIKEPDAVVCYGAGYIGPKPSLNSECSDMDKLEQAFDLIEALPDNAIRPYVIQAADLGQQIRYFQTNMPGIFREEELTLPVVARKVKHSKGKDMRICRTLRGLQAMLAADKHDFVTGIVESDTEFRVWVYRKRVLAIYEKRLTEPEKNRKFGRNRANGWTFHKVPLSETSENVRRVAVAAVKALSLDFGAVDILGKNTEQGMHATVLEVNSAPGVSDEHRSAIVRLVDRIVQWAKAGCPGRGE